MFSRLTLKSLQVAALGLVLSFALSLAFVPAAARAQLNTFSSGSTGADGAFAPATNQTLQVPESGVFNFTTFNVPQGFTITFARNSKNSPVTILATGAVTIAGIVTVSGGSGLSNGGGGRGGPGGYDGGAAGFGFDTFVGATGDGPGGGGGGTSTNGTNLGGGGGGGYALVGNTGGAQNANSAGGAGGAKYGASPILPLIGGSGGGGGGAVSGNRGGSGGGGGGAILIASSTSISFTATGQITSLGGPGVVVGAAGAAGGGGSGGAIRLIANAITGGGVLNVSGGNAGGTSTFPGGGNGAAGFVRVEAFNSSGFTPSVPTNSATFALPNPVTIPNAPTLTIASVAGVAAPATPLGSLAGAPDIVVPSTTSNPVPVAIEATNIPVGTLVQVTLIPLNGERTNAQTGPLSGTEAASTASTSLLLPSGMCVLTASAVVDVSQQAMFIDGERVNRIEVAASYGGSSQVTYVTRSGRRVTSTQ